MDIAQQLREASADRDLMTKLHLKIEDELIDRRDRKIFTGNRNGLVAFDRDSTPSPVIRMGTREAVIFVLQLMAEHFDTADDDDDTEGCEGHVDTDDALTSGAGIGEPVTCDGSCNPKEI